MSLDDIFLLLQNGIDRLVRWLRIGAAPPAGRRHLLIIQIDGLARSVLEQGLTEGRMPFLRRLLARGAYRITPMSVGLPTSTPAFQLAAMYGVRPDIPGFHYHDKRRRTDVYFPRAGDAAWVEREQAGGRLGIVRGGSTYGCVFTGGASNNLFSFAVFKRPTGRGIVTALSAFVVLAWVAVKGLALTVVELTRALLRFIADPVRESARGWKFLAIKVGISVWLRELFTLAVSRDLYAGIPVVYVNYLDYDVFAHAYGPRHPRAMRALRRVDRSLRKLWTVVRRVPEHSYDVYVLSDHGQAACIPYVRLAGGEGFETRLFEEVLEPTGAHMIDPGRPEGRRLVQGIKAYRSHRESGMWQRFVNYLEHDFPRLMGELPEARERGAVRVVSAGPNAFIYFLDVDSPLTLQDIDARAPGLAEKLSRTRGVGFVLARSAQGPICIWRGKRYHVADGEAGPFAGRDDLELVRTGVVDLMAMPSAGDFVVYGLDTPEGNISYVAELGAHAGPSPDELHTFVVHSARVTLPAEITHPIQLYPHFVAYQEAA